MAGAVLRLVVAMRGAVIGPVRARGIRRIAAAGQQAQTAAAAADALEDAAVRAVAERAHGAILRVLDVAALLVRAVLAAERDRRRADRIELRVQVEIGASAA